MSYNKTVFAFMDDESNINIYDRGNELNKIKLYVNEEEINNIEILNWDYVKLIKSIKCNIKANDLVYISDENNEKYFKVEKREYLNRYYFHGNLGLNFFKNEVEFSLWAPTSYKVEVVIYNEYNLQKDNYTTIAKLNYDENTGVHSLKINKKEIYEKYYLYKVYHKDINSNGEIIENMKYAIDPYSKLVGVNGDKGYVYDLSDKKCEILNWSKEKSPKLKNKIDSILYEMHIRDFTIDKTSGVKEELRGTYLGMVEEGTIYEDELTGIKVKTGIDHLKELGITHVHLLPTYDFATVNEEKNLERNWGYDPKNFNAIEGSYSTNPYDPTVRVKEFRTMVSKLHKNGIRVVLDVVYNHMYSTENLNNIVPHFYFRENNLGCLSNGSGCGNEICSERPMVRKFIVDSCIHLIENYKIDGLRFDLMELIDLDTIKELVRLASKYDSNFLIYGEPWTGGGSLVKNGTYKGSQKKLNFSVFNDNFRDSIRGNNMPSKGFVNGDSHNPNNAWGVVEGLKGSIYTIAEFAQESINYLDAHDNYTFWDQIEKSQNHNLINGDYRNIKEEKLLENYNIRQYLLGAGILFTSQGIPFFQGGAEFLRTKQGDHNSYKSNDEINAIKWNDKVKYNEIFKYYKELIKIRKKYSEFKLNNSSEIKKYINISFAHNDQSSGVIISRIKIKDNDEEIILIYNGTSIDDYSVFKEVNILEKNKYKSIISSNKIVNEKELKEILKLKSYSITILVNKEE